MSVARELVQRLGRLSAIGDWRLQAGLWLAALLLATVRQEWGWLLLTAAVTASAAAWARWHHYPLESTWLPPTLRIAHVSLLAVVIGGVLASAFGKVWSGSPDTVLAQQNASAVPSGEGADKPTPNADAVKRAADAAEAEKKRRWALYMAALAGTAGSPETRAKLDPDTRAAVDALPAPLTPATSPSDDSPAPDNGDASTPDVGPVIAQDPAGVGGWLGRLCLDAAGGAASGMSAGCAMLGLMLGNVGISLGGGGDIHEQAAALRSALGGTYGPLIALLGDRPLGRGDGMAQVLDRLRTHIGVDIGKFIDHVRNMPTSDWCGLLSASTPAVREDWLTWAKSNNLRAGAICG